MAGQTPPTQVSRLWLRRYGRPRAADGTFAPGYFLFSRPDGTSRFVYYPEQGPDDLSEYRWLANEGVRVMTHLFVIALAALLWWWLG